MESNRICNLFVIVFYLQFRGYRAPCDVSTYPVLYTWPLGEGIFSYELTTQSWSGDHNNIGYNTGPSFLGYNAVEFNASAESYIEFPVQDYNKPQPDYAISFFLYVKSDGVFLHYKSDDYGNDTKSIESFKLEMDNGNIRATIFSSNNSETLETQATVYITDTYNTWLPIVYQRDWSQNKVKFEVNGAKPNADTALWVNKMDSSFPGTLRLGGSMDGESYFSGRVACVQMIPCKDPPLNDSYIFDCAETNWPPSSTTSTTTTTTPSATTTTPTTTATTQNFTPTTATAIMTYTSNTTILTSTTITPTSTNTVATITTPVPLSPAVSTTSFANCRRYKRVNQNVTFSAGEALDAVKIVNSPLACSVKCSTHGSCWSFVYKPGGSCWLGPSNPTATTGTGAVLYEVV